ncbi:MAG: hypothetical protein PHP30_07990 [Bacteroidales bacterium]|nr:hypothetical protein [Bacteroidales bacterium]MDD4639646.1 hypothetical protein [Bacteroidales bacterium]
MRLFSLMLAIILPLFLTAQERELKVTVINHKNKPVRSVKLETFPGKEKGTTDKNGICTLVKITDEDSLIVIYPGAERSFHFSLTGVNELHFDTSKDEPVGYDPVKKNWVGGNVRKIIKKGELDIETEIRNGALNLEDILKRMPSLMVTSGTVSLRNAVKTNENPDISPLIVVDNFVVRGGLSEANRTVNINLIESITVEKDGTLWGREGLNGVILIKLKK